MKHVFVESNFLIELLRPFPSPEAEALYGRHNVDVELHLPWCSTSEAKRTLSRIIGEDLGFTDAMMTFATRRWLADKTLFDKQEIDKLKQLAAADRKDALQTVDQRLTTCVNHLSVIRPSQQVIDRTLRVFEVKALKPFDEMVLGAVLWKAEELYTQGERELYFCELDRDLASQHPPLRQQFLACGLEVLRDFRVA